MRPKNAREREILALSRKTCKVSDAKMHWIEEEVVEKRIFTSGRACWCSECGQGWKERLAGEVATCPHCGKKAKVERSRKTTHYNFAYVQFLQIVKGYQVIRYFVAEWSSRKGRERRLTLTEVMQKWCQPGRPMVTLGAGLVCYPWSCRIPYSLWSSLSIKPNYGEWYREWMEVTVYPKMSLLPVYRKNLGARPDFSALCAPTILGSIFGCPYLESLWKAGKVGELKKLLRYVDELDKYWPSVKVALRHGYTPPDWGNYFDYLKMVKFLHYDMRSPRYVAPPDWSQIHERMLTQYRNRLAEMQRRRDERAAVRRAQAEEERLARAKEEAKEARKSFGRRIAKFAALVIEDEDIVIKPLLSIQEFADEGDAMHHCVFTNGYYKKPESLILSARTKQDGKRVETVEVGLRDMTVLQSFGFGNSITPRHDEIKSLVAGAMPLIDAMAHPRRKAVSAGRS